MLDVDKKNKTKQQQSHTDVLLQQETPTNELSSSAPTIPAPVSIKRTKLELRGKSVSIT